MAEGMWWKGSKDYSCTDQTGAAKSSKEMESRMEEDIPAKEQKLAVQNIAIQADPHSADVDRSKGAIPKKRAIIRPLETAVEAREKTADSSEVRVAQEIIDTVAEVSPDRDKILAEKKDVRSILTENLNERIICAPKLIYSGSYLSCIATPDNRGIWRVESERKLYKTAEARSWILISFADENVYDMTKLLYFAECLMNSSRKCGLLFGRPIEIKLFDEGVSTEGAVAFAKKTGAQFAVVVLKMKGGSHSYKDVKYFADVKYNLVTQCMDDKTLVRINDQIATNVCLKINAKLGGINHVLMHTPTLSSKPFMLFGAHVMQVSSYCSSISAMVGCPQVTSAKYSFTCRLQDNENEGICQEIIADVRDMTKELLSMFVDGTELPTHRIIFFRHGISDSQLSSALQCEIKGIQDACRELYQVIFPITYIVVQKIHNTTLRPQDLARKLGKTVNIAPSTPFCNKRATAIQDYFICSQGDKQGISRPTRYSVIHDDNNCLDIDLQQMSYYLCYNYACSTQSVSLPAPVLYAASASERAKNYVAYLISECDDIDVTGVQSAVANMNKLGNNMFFV